MKKRMLSLLCVLALCLGLLPVTALAAEGAPGSLYVAGQQITDEGYYTQSGGNWTKSDDPSTPPSAPYFHYTKGNDNTPATLTLSGATIQGGTSTGTVPYGAGIYAQCSNGQSVTLTIKLIGENTITGYYGIYVNAEISADSYGTDASLTITGESNGSLKVSGSYHGIYVKSGTGGASLNINDASVVASSSPTNFDYAGVYVQSSAHATSSPQLSLAVNGGSLTASGTGSSDGISFYVGSSNATGATTSLTVSENAIVDARNGGISALKISETLPTPTPTGDNRSGIVFDDKNGTVYGNVTLDESLTINQGETLTVPDGSKLDCKNNLTNKGTILVEKGGNLTGNPGGKVVYAPAITNHPQDVEVKENETANFTVEATGSDLSYQWQKSTDNGSNWTDITGETNTTYTTGKTTMDMSGTQYRCVVKNSIDEVTSDAATLTVTALPEPEPEPEPTPPPYIPPTYAVTTPETTGGTVTVSPSRASSGRTVTITAAPDTGFALESLTVLDSRGNEIALTDKGDGKYTFTMPASRVTVEASFAPVPLPFEDVAPGAWYEEAVRYAYFHNIMEGMRETEFSPTTALTRAMAVQILYNLEGQPDLSSENLGYPYEDVDAQAWYGDAVYWARITGVATGYGDGTFQPGDSITRQEFAQMLYNYAKYKGYDLTAEGDLAQFPDSESVADWAEAAMRWANGNQLINGHDDGTIDAAGIGTRAQAASILMKFDQNLVEN